MLKAYLNYASCQIYFFVIVLGRPPRTTVLIGPYEGLLVIAFYLNLW